MAVSGTADAGSIPAWSANVIWLLQLVNLPKANYCPYVAKAIFIGVREPDYLKNLLSRTSNFLQVLVGNGLYTYRY